MAPGQGGARRAENDRGWAIRKATGATSLEGFAREGRESELLMPNTAGDQTPYRKTHPGNLKDALVADSRKDCAA